MVSSWVNTTSNPGVTTPISIAQTGNKPDSVFDAYYETSRFANDQDTLGLTSFYVYGNNVQSPAEWGPPNQNWGWTTIRLNPNGFN
ncbi:hypothetical protein [Clostridium cellulovorans]|uniref:Uncharacterized protein n=1 Tax=Clostridium cellulovorans (strain ATCC 35296 / DSM 3052 / OCM 3 / 743B) TaxID=573061 RepID=D9SQZ4_CLOC7|nr:hypothetical protein [Clostridium cellulovorans]ADL50282.1 hypothetical protein Clocel_0507 [Clostridium cellulovorans 743B]